MAYLRWSDSPWYVYWSWVGEEEIKGRENQVLWVGYSMDNDDQGVYAYHEIKGIIESESWDKLPGYDKESDRDQAKFRDALVYWIEDVEKEYGD